MVLVTKNLGLSAGFERLYPSFHAIEAHYFKFIAFLLTSFAGAPPSS